MVGSLLRFLIVLAVLAAIIAAAWNEPLRYRFMSAAKIAQEEAALFPKPSVPTPKGTDWRQYGTSLDRAPYQRQADGSVSYTQNYDRYQLGTSTESVRRQNATQQGVNAQRPGANQ